MYCTLCGGFVLEGPCKHTRGITLSPYHSTPAPYAQLAARLAHAEGTIEGLKNNIDTLLKLRELDRELIDQLRKNINAGHNR